MEAEGAEAVVQLTDGRVYYCVVEGVDPATHKNKIILYPFKSRQTPEVANNGNTPCYVEDNDAVHSVSLNETLALNGLATVDPKSNTSILGLLKEAQAQARKARLNMWQHGDVDGYESDSNAFRRPHTSKPRYVVFFSCASLHPYSDLAVIHGNSQVTS